MRSLLITFLLLVLLQDVIYSQTCPTYGGRNNGQNTNGCYANDNPPSGYTNKTGHFDFSPGSTLIPQKIYLNNVLIQNETGRVSGDLFFGAIDGTSGDLCFYGAPNATAPPAGRWRFEFLNSSNNSVICTYNFSEAGALVTLNPGEIGINQTICTGQSPNELTSITNATNFSSYQWQKSTTSASSGFENITGATSSTYSPGQLTQTTYFQRNALDASNFTYASNVITVTVVSSTSWTGTSGTTFNTSSNWNPIVSSLVGCSVAIPSSSTGTPQLGASITLSSLTVEAGKSINLSNNNLTLTGDFSNNGSIIGDGNLIFGGASAQSITGNGTVKNINFNNSVGTSITSGDNKLNILGVLSVTSGTITTNDNLVFKATSTEEGIVGTISTCPTDPFIGNVTVERYIPATARSLRFITPGVNSTSFTINQNWQEGVNEQNRFNYGSGAINPKNPKPGYGTHITGSTTGLDGLDATITGNPSMYAFENRTTGYGWQTITNTDTTKFRRPGQAFAIMIRGDRSIDLTSNTPPHTSTILRTKGRLTNCNYSFSSDVNSLVPLSPTADAYSFIGNPYWSIVNWSRVSRTNIDNRIYYFDPAITGTNSVGGYVTLSMVNEANEGEDLKQFSGNGGRISRYLQPGQGFFVRNGPSNSLPIISFEEADKENSTARKFDLFSKNPSGNISEGGTFDQVRVRSSNKYEKIFVSLYLKQNVNKAPADGFLITYNQNFSDGFSLEDAPKLSNQDENMFVDFAGRKLAIVGLKPSVEIKSDTIPVSFTNLYDQDYIVHFDFTNNVDPQREIFLINKSSGSRQKINDGQVFDFAFRPQPGIRTNSDYLIVVNSKKIENKGRVRKPVTVITNPITNGLLQFSVPKENISNEAQRNIQVNIFDLSGKLLFTKTIEKSMNIYESVNVDNLRAGTYLLKIMHDDQVHTKKIFKQ